MNHWHSWGVLDQPSTNPPLPAGFQLAVYRRKGLIESVLESENLTMVAWEQTGAMDDIIAFKVLGLSAGYIYPKNN